MAQVGTTGNQGGSREVKNQAETVETSGVFFLALLTLVSLAVVAAAGVTIGCVLLYPEAVVDGSSHLCKHLSGIGLEQYPLIGVGIAFIGVMAVTVMWRSAFRRWRRRRRVESTGSLGSNIHRLPENPPESEAMAIRSMESQERHEIWERVDQMAKSMRSQELPGRELVTTWLGLLRTANDLHNQGQLSTEDFKVINTRLLDLVSDESERNRPATVV